jgi:hypothetical protein
LFWAGDLLLAKHYTGKAQLRTASQKQKVDDQETDKLVYCNLDPRTHATGYATNNYEKYEQDMARLGLTPVVLHANWCVGHDQKVKNLKAAKGAWLDNCTWAEAGDRDD